VKRTSWSRGLSVTADGSGVLPLAGAVAVRLLADRVGLTSGLSTALARRGFTPGHDRGQVWVDVAVMLLAGGEAIARYNHDESVQDQPQVRAAQLSCSIRYRRDCRQDRQSARRSGPSPGPRRRRPSDEDHV
jgi:hypothetical protein